MIKPFIIVLLGFTGSSEVPVKLEKEIEGFYGIEIVGVKKVKSSPNMIEPIRNRYKADVVLSDMQDTFSDNGLLILTSRDIAIRKNGNYDWGILGYSFVGKEVGLVSTKRIKSQDLLVKVTLHEFGHSLGLPHCSSSQACLMKDAKGRGETIRKQRKRLCEACHKTLKALKRNRNGNTSYWDKFLELFKN
ncbi:matrixin family metalloprotease [Aquirufa regiilacus]